MSLLPIPGQVGNIPAGNGQPGFMSTIGGLLTGSSPYAPLLNASLGLLAAGGPSVTPKNTMQRLAEGLLTGGQITQGQQKGLLANQLQRAKLQQYADQKERRANAQKAIPGLLEKLGPQTVQTGPPGTAGGEVTTPGLLSSQQVTALQSAAQLDPEGVAGLLAKGVAEQAFSTGAAQPNVIRTLTAAGIDPKSPEGQDLIRRSVAGEDMSGVMAKLEATRLALQVQRDQQELNAAKRDTDKEDRETNVARINLRDDIATNVTQSMRAAEILDKLEGTLLEPGFAGVQRGNLASAVAFAKEQFGANSNEVKKLVSLQEEFNRAATSSGIENLSALKGSSSDREFNTMIGLNLSLDKTTDANRAAIADQIEFSIKKADAEGIAVPKREQAEELIRKLRNRAQPGATESAQPDVSMFEGKTQAELLQMKEQEMTLPELQAWSAALAKSAK